MARVKRGIARHKRHKKMTGMAEGYWGRKKNVFRRAKEQVMKAGQYAFRDRRAKKRDFRRLWIVRLNAACKSNGIKYNDLIHGLKEKSIPLDRKMLSELAIHDPEAFKQVVSQATG